MLETGIGVNAVIAELTKSPHGDLKSYLPTAVQAAKEDPDFFGHLVAWNYSKGTIRDAKKALPIAALMGMPNESPSLLSPSLFTDNALAHLALLNPREFLLAYRFALEVRPKGHMSALRRLIHLYIKDLEADNNEWNRAALRHKDTLQALYSLGHISRPMAKGAVLFGGEGSRRRGTDVYPVEPIFGQFVKLRGLANLNPIEAAGVIITGKIPYLTAKGYLGAKSKDPAVICALIDAMTPNELTTNLKQFEKLAAQHPEIKSAISTKLSKMGAKATHGVNILKTAKAIETIEDDALRERARDTQAKQIKQNMSVDGNWLVLGDRSGSMTAAIEASRHVAATLAMSVKGKVVLCFFNSIPTAVDVTGMDYDQIKKKTEHITATGGTSIGCGLLHAIGNKFVPDGIAIVSDQAENAPPFFADVYGPIVASSGKDIPVYLYRIGDVRIPYGYSDKLLTDSMRDKGHDLQVFPLGSTVDYYSIPNLAKTMRVNRYSLHDEIMDTPLKTVAQVLPNAKKGELTHA